MQVKIFSFYAVSRYPGLPGTVFKKTRYPAVRNFDQFSRNSLFILLRTQDICLEIPNDCKYCLGLKVEATVERGQKIFKFRHTESTTDEYPQKLSTKPHQSILVFVQKCPAILNKGFVLLWTNSLSLH